MATSPPREGWDNHGWCTIFVDRDITRAGVVNETHDKIPLSECNDAPSISWSGDHATLNATKFFKEHDIDAEQTIRYEAEWDSDITGDGLPGAVTVDLREDGEVVHSQNSASDSEEAIDDSE